MRRKILFILHLPPPIHGAAMVGKLIHSSPLINDSFECDYINLATSKSLEETGKWNLKKISTFNTLLLKIYSALRKKKYDVCYMTITAEGAGFYKDIPIVSILKAFKQNIIFHFHNKGVSSNQHKTVDNLLYRYVFNGTKSILLSKHLYTDIQKYVKEENVYYCPNGIPTVTESIKNPKERITSTPFQILFLSNMMEEKGVWVLLETCRILKIRGLQFECHFIGAWSDIKEKEFNSKIQAFKLETFAFAHGKKYNEEKTAFFQNADVFVFPTFYHYETFGLVNLEAMQFGLPIIATPEGGIPDVVLDKETGFLVPQKDAGALADKIQLLYENPALAIEMGEKGKKRFQENFTVEKFERKMTEILQEC